MIAFALLLASCTAHMCMFQPAQRGGVTEDMNNVAAVECSYSQVGVVSYWVVCCGC